VKNPLISVNLKFLMGLKSVTQQMLAEELGISTAMVNNYVNGKSEPNSVNLTKICDYFGVSVDAFVRGELSHEETLNTENPDATMLRLIRLYDAQLAAKEDEIADIQARYEKMKRKYPEIVRRMEEDE